MKPTNHPFNPALHLEKDWLDNQEQQLAMGQGKTVLANAVMLEIPGDLAYVHLLSRCVCALLENDLELEEPDITLYNLELAIQEVAVNIVTHAYTHYHGRIHLYAALDVSPLRLTLLLHDTGIAFDPEKVPPPRLGELQEHGFGLFLIRQLMDEVEYQTSKMGNTWKLVKLLPTKTVYLTGEEIDE